MGKRCEDKRRYESRAAAKRDAKRLRQFGRDKGRPYRCPDCLYWHLTHAPADARAFLRQRTRLRGGDL